jgi:hypothetical protein
VPRAYAVLSFRGGLSIFVLLFGKDIHFLYWRKNRNKLGEKTVSHVMYLNIFEMPPLRGSDEYTL